MIIALILAVVSVTVLTFLAGYRLAVHHYKLDDEHWLALHELDNATGTPIYAALDREWKYTEELNRPFTNEK
jgi:hypothetical protein